MACGSRGCRVLPGTTHRLAGWRQLVPVDRSRPRRAAGVECEVFRISGALSGQRVFSCAAAGFDRSRAALDPWSADRLQSGRYPPRRIDAGMTRAQLHAPDFERGLRMNGPRVSGSELGTTPFKHEASATELRVRSFWPRARSSEVHAPSSKLGYPRNELGTRRSQVGAWVILPVRWSSTSRVSSLHGGAPGCGPGMPGCVPIPPTKTGAEAPVFSSCSRNACVRRPSSTAPTQQGHSASRAAQPSSALRRNSPACPCPTASVRRTASRGRTRTTVASSAGPSGSLR